VQFDGPVKRLKQGHPGMAGVDNFLNLIDPRLRRDDKKEDLSAFYGSVKFESFSDNPAQKETLE
jgi:hypothetical protein